MGARTKLSAKGQVMIPKDVRDRLGWAPGTTLEVTEAPGGGIGVRKAGPDKPLSFEEATARLRAAADYRGPSFTEDEWRESIDGMLRNRPEP